jgi:hypothetical protein
MTNNGTFSAASSAGTLRGLKNKKGLLSANRASPLQENTIPFFQ